MHLNQNDIDNLKLLADKGAIEGHSEAAARLRELLEAYQEREALAAKKEASDTKNKERGEALKEIATKVSGLKLRQRNDADDMETEKLKNEVQELRSMLEEIGDLADEQP